MKIKDKMYLIVVDSDEDVTSFKAKLEEKNIDTSYEDLQLRLDSYRFKNRTVKVFVNDKNRIIKWSYNTSSD